MKTQETYALYRVSLNSLWGVITFSRLANHSFHLLFFSSIGINQVSCLQTMGGTTAYPFSTSISIQFGDRIFLKTKNEMRHKKMFLKKRTLWLWRELNVGYAHTPSSAVRQLASCHCSPLLIQAAELQQSSCCSMKRWQYPWRKNVEGGEGGMDWNSYLTCLLHTHTNTCRA